MTVHMNMTDNAKKLRGPRYLEKIAHGIFWSARVKRDFPRKGQSDSGYKEWFALTRTQLKTGMKKAIAVFAKHKQVEKFKWATLNSGDNMNELTQIFYAR